MATGEVGHDPIVGHRDQVAPVGHLIGGEGEAQRSGLDGRATRVVAGGVIPEDGHVSHIAARRHARGDDLGQPHLPPGG